MLELEQIYQTIDPLRHLDVSWTFPQVRTLRDVSPARTLKPKSQRPDGYNLLSPFEKQLLEDLEENAT